MSSDVNMVEYALHYAKLGFAVFPVCSTNKKPHTPHGCKDAKTDIGAIKAWWERWPNASIGIATGEASHGLVVVDLDQDDDKGLDGYTELEKWQKENGELPETWRSITGRGGYHLFFFSKDKQYQNRAGLLDGIDVRGEGGYIIAPPSLHPNGRRYEWEISPEDGIPMAQVNDTVDKLLTWKLAKAAGESGSRDPDRVKFELPEVIPSGQRNDLLFRYACSLQAKGIPNDAIYDYVNLANQNRCNPPVDAEEVATIVSSAIGYEKGSEPIPTPSFSGWHEPQIETTIRKINGEEVEVALQTYENCREAVEYDLELFGKIKYNELAYAPYVCGSLPWKDTTLMRPWDNEDDANLLAYLENHYTLSNKDKIMNALTRTAGRHRFNPVKDVLEDVYDKWKEAGSPTGYIAKLLPKYLGVEDSEYTQAVMRIFMLGAISRIYNPGCKYDYTVIFVGDQGAGKSTFLRFLAMSNVWFSDNFNTVESDKASEKLRGMWIVEMAELLATKRAKDVEAIKSFLTSTEDNFRPPFERRTEQRKRMCVFAGTTNNESFLTDRTGNRRFLPIRVSKGNIQVVMLEHPDECSQDIALAWGEAMQLFTDAEGRPKLYLPEHLQKIAEDMQQQFTEEDSRIGIIQKWLDEKSDDRTCVREIWDSALQENNSPTKRDSNEIAEIMRFSITGWKKCEKVQRCGAYGRQVCYERIEKAARDFVDADESKVPNKFKCQS